MKITFVLDPVFHPLRTATFISKMAEEDVVKEIAVSDFLIKNKTELLACYWTYALSTCIRLFRSTAQTNYVSF